jgi:hypothetical protein
MKKDLHRLTRRWLGRFSFTFLVIAFFLAYEGYRRYQILRGEMDWRAMLYFFAATVSVVLAFTGLRERHRHDDDA